MSTQNGETFIDGEIQRLSSCLYLYYSDFINTERIHPVRFQVGNKYQYSDNLSFKFEGKNLGNRPEYYYWNTSDRLSQYDEYGYTLSFGVRYSY